MHKPISTRTSTPVIRPGSTERRHRGSGTRVPARINEAGCASPTPISIAVTATKRHAQPLRQRQPLREGPQPAADPKRALIWMMPKKRDYPAVPANFSAPRQAGLFFEARRASVTSSPHGRRVTSKIVTLALSDASPDLSVGIRGVLLRSVFSPSLYTPLNTPYLLFWRWLESGSVRPLRRPPATLNYPSLRVVLPGQTAGAVDISR
jgi:hypothetical protein